MTHKVTQEEARGSHTSSPYPFRQLENPFPETVPSLFPKHSLYVNGIHASLSFTVTFIMILVVMVVVLGRYFWLPPS